MQILDRDVPQYLEALYQEVVDQRPDATIRFTRGVQSGGASRGWHQPDTRGNSEILLTPDYDDFTLAHEFIHALLYRRGFPYLHVLVGNEQDYGGIVEAISCCVSHPTLHEEVRKHGLDALWRDASLAAAAGEGDLASPISEDALALALWLADALDFDAEAAAPLAERCRTEHPAVWAVAERLHQTMERCHSLSAQRWRRAMVDLMTYFDALYLKEHPGDVPPSKGVAVSLVLTEPQLTRPAERLFEAIPLNRNIVGFTHKQDGSVFHLYYAPPGHQKQDLASLRDSLKRFKVEPFLDAYEVPYSVDLGAGRAK